MAWNGERKRKGRIVSIRVRGGRRGRDAVHIRQTGLSDTYWSWPVVVVRVCAFSFFPNWRDRDWVSSLIYLPAALSTKCLVCGRCSVDTWWNGNKCVKMNLRANKKLISYFAFFLSLQKVLYDKSVLKNLRFLAYLLTLFKIEFVTGPQWIQGFWKVLISAAFGMK